MITEKGQIIFGSTQLTEMGQIIFGSVPPNAALTENGDLVFPAPVPPTCGNLFRWMLR